MKKLSLKNAKKILSRKEMKAIKGGGYSIGNCCAVIMEFGNPWQSCGLTQQEAEYAVCSYTVPHTNDAYPNSYWTCTN